MRKNRIMAIVMTVVVLTPSAAYARGNEKAQEAKERTKPVIEQKSTVEKNSPVPAAKAEQERNGAQQMKNGVQSKKIEAQTKSVEAQEKASEKKEAVQNFRKAMQEKREEIKKLTAESSALRREIGKKREELEAILEELIAGTKTLSDELLAQLIDEASDLKEIGDIVKSLNSINDEVVAAEDKIKEKNFDSALASLDRVIAKQQQRLEALKELNKSIDRLLEIARQAQVPAEDLHEDTTDQPEETSDENDAVDVIIDEEQEELEETLEIPSMD
jgi:hypothetical protein